MAVKVRAKSWLNHNGVWHSGGEIFEIDEKETEAMSEHVEVLGTFVSDVFPPEQEQEEKPVQKKRGRPKKSANDN